MADRPLTDKDLALAYEQGLKDAADELLPFQSIGGVRFATDVAHFVAAQAYELDLIRELPATQERVAWARQDEQHATTDHAKARTAAHAARHAPRTARGSRRLLAAVRRLIDLCNADAFQRTTQQRMEDRIEARQDLQLHAAQLQAALDDVRGWLDEHLEMADEYRAARADRRRENRLPYELVLYHDATDFWQQDDRRLLPGSTDEPGGAYYGGRWTLQTPGEPWLTTTWAIYWLQHGELYARDFTSPRLRDEGVILLGRLPFPRRFSDDDAFLTELQQTVMHERNSLVAAADAIIARRKTREQQPHSDAP